MAKDTKQGTLQTDAFGGAKPEPKPEVSQDANTSAPAGNGVSTAQLKPAANDELPPPNPGRRPSNELSDVRTSVSESPEPAPQIATQDPPVVQESKPAEDVMNTPGRYLVEFRPETGVAHGYIELDAESSKHAWKEYCKFVGVSGSRTAPKIERFGDKTGEAPVFGPPVEPLKVSRRDPILAD